MSVLVHSVVARNDAAASENKIHDDAVSRQYGFAGGLVPGVTVYGYLCWAPATQWGRDWLERGTMSARFVQPVYDGDTVEVRGTPGPDETLELTVHDSTGRLCATGQATLPVTPLPVPDFGDLPDTTVPDGASRPPATDAVLGAIDLATIEETWTASRRAELQGRLGDDLALYDAEQIAHPGGLIRAANHVLSHSVRLGPWIHVSSAVTHHGSVPDGSRVTTRGRTADLYERKGHRFVELDILATLSPGGEPVLSARHVAIYEPRRVSGDSWRGT